MRKAVTEVYEYENKAICWLCIIYDCETPSSIIWKIWRIMEKLSRGGETKHNDTKYGNKI